MSISIYLVIFYYKEKKNEIKWWPYRGAFQGQGTRMERLCSRYLQKLDLQFCGKAASVTQGPWVIWSKEQEKEAISTRHRHPPCVVLLYACIALRTLPTTPVLALQTLPPNPSTKVTFASCQVWSVLGPQSGNLNQGSMNVRSETMLACLLYSQRVEKKPHFPKTPEETVAKGHMGELSEFYVLHHT